MNAAIDLVKVRQRLHAWPAHVRKGFNLTQRGGLDSWVTLMAVLPVLHLAIVNLAFIVALPLGVGSTVAFAAYALLAYSLVERWLPCLAMTALALLASVAFSYLTPDGGFDSYWYHLDAVNCLSSGWNYIWEGACEGGFSSFYPPLAWVLAAPFAAVFGIEEPMNVLSPYLTFVAALALFRLLNHTLKVGAIISALVTAAALGNPPHLAHLGTAYNDGAVYLMLLLALTFFAKSLAERGDRVLVLCAFVSLLAGLAALKYSAAVYAAFLALGAVAALGLKYRKLGLAFWRRRLSAPVAVGILLTITLAHPYATNIFGGRHLLHPVAGEAASDFVDQLELACFDRVGTLAQPIIASLLPMDTAAHTCTDRINDLAVLRLDAMTSIPSDMAYPGTWTVNGFGPYFPILVLLFGLVAAFAAVRPRPARGLTTLARLIPLVAVVLYAWFFFGPNWWARYVPQFWLVPILTPLLLYSYGGRLATTLAACTAGLGVVAGAHIAIGVAKVGLITHAEHEKFRRSALVGTPVLGDGLPMVFSQNSRDVMWGAEVPLTPPDADGLVSCRSAQYFNLIEFVLAPSVLNEPPTLTELLGRQDFWLLVTVSDEASSGLTEEQKERFRARGVEIDQLQFRGAFAAIIRPGGAGAVAEFGGTQAPLVLEGEMSFSNMPNATVQLRSVGFEAGAGANIQVDRVELLTSGAVRGMNVAAFTSEGRFVGYWAYDTFEGSDTPQCPS